MKERTRLFYAGHATYRIVKWDRGFGGPYGQTRQPAIWVCVDCGRKLRGEDDRPYIRELWGRYNEPCADNGHAPCRLCGAMLPRLNCGCPREHRWTECPGKTEADRMVPQHAHVGHDTRRIA